MELRQLRYFLSIVRHASFNKAAAALNLTQPALSKSMRALEYELGVSLLERSVNGVAATPYGRILASYASLATIDLDRAVSEVNAMAGRGSGTIRLGASASYLRYFIPAIKTIIFKRDPKIEIVLHEGLRDEVLGALRRGHIDIVVATELDPGAAQDLAQERLLTDRLCVVASELHPLLSNTKVLLADLSSQRWVVPNAQEPERVALAKSFDRAGLPDLQVAMETSSSPVMAQMVHDELALSYLTRKLLRIDPTYAKLREVPFDLNWPDIHICLIRRKAAVMLPAVRALIAACKQFARQLDEADSKASLPVLAASDMRGRLRESRLRKRSAKRPPH